MPVFVTAKEFTIHGIACYVYWQRFDIRDINKRMRFALEFPGEGTPLAESFPFREVVHEFDSHVEVG